MADGLSPITQHVRSNTRRPGSPVRPKIGRGSGHSGVRGRGGRERCLPTHRNSGARPLIHKKETNIHTFTNLLAAYMQTFAFTVDYPCIILLTRRSSMSLVFIPWNQPSLYLVHTYPSMPCSLSCEMLCSQTPRYATQKNKEDIKMTEK